MIKKVAGIIIGAAIIIMGLVFVGNALLGVDTSAVEGTVYENTTSLIMTVGDAGLNLLVVIPVLLIIGAFIIVASLIKTKGNGGSRRRKR